MPRRAAARGVGRHHPARDRGQPAENCGRRAGVGEPAGLPRRADRAHPWGACGGRRWRLARGGGWWWPLPQRPGPFGM